MGISPWEVAWDGACWFVSPQDLLSVTKVCVTGTIAPQMPDLGILFMLVNIDPAVSSKESKLPHSPINKQILIPIFTEEEEINKLSLP